MAKKIFILVFTFISSAIFADSSKTILITGGAGFIGSNFLQYMYEKYPDYRFIVLDALTYAGSLENISPAIQQSDRFEFIHGSVCNFPLVDQVMARSQLVVHFAAETHVPRSIEADEVFFQTDVMGTRCMMAALLKHANTVERFIHISTSEVYGTAEGNLPMSEEHPLKPRSPYAAAKAGADRCVYAYGCTFDVPVVIVRPFNNYGPRQHPEKMIPQFITSILQQKPLQIHGDGHQSRDWIHTKDVSTALDRILHHPDFSTLKNRAINIGSARATSVLDIAHAILKAFNLPPTHMEFVADRPGQVECHLAQIDTARKLLNWAPTIGLAEGLQDTIDWYVNNPEYWKKVKQ